MDSDNDILKQNLRQLGFTPNQADVYLALLDLGQTKAGPIVSRLGIHRHIIYRALDDLLAKKMVGKIIKRGVAYFNAANPEPLQQEFKNQYELARQVTKRLKTHVRLTPTEVSVLAGKSGLVNLYRLLINAGENIYVLGGKFEIINRLKGDAAIWEKMFVRRKVKHFVLAQGETKISRWRRELGEIRFLPKSFPATPHVIWIAGDIVAQVLWEDQETFIVIKNKRIAESYRHYFRLLWSRARPWRR